MANIKQIKIFSTTWCPYCKMEEAWLKDKKLRYQTIMVDEDPAAAMYMIEKTGQRGVPVTEVMYDDDTSKYVIGFDRPTLGHLLGI